MNKLKIDLENCFGIGKLNTEIDFTRSNTFLIYAPNGTMKTSFAKTFDLISKQNPQNQPCDRVYSARITTISIISDDVEINANNILVINAEDNTFDASSKISTFLASRDLKDKYDEIYLDLTDKKDNFIKKLKGISQSTDCEEEFIETFSPDSGFSFLEALLLQLPKLKDTYNKPNFRYNDVFDKKGNVKKFLDKNQEILSQYISDYKNIISKSKFFKDSIHNKFGTYQANEIIKSIEDNSFFDAGHKFVLEDGTEIENSEQLKKLVQDEIQSILNDNKLKKAFDKVDKAIGANAELRTFQKVIEKDNLILVNLGDYEKFKKQIWIEFICEIQQDTIELITYFKEKKKILEKIIEEAKKEFALWIKIIKTFNSRFYVPFKVVLVNQDDIILKQKTANLEFEYSDRNDVPVRQKRDALLNILSKGEQRAYFILQFLFEIESRKLLQEKNLLIFDDIADSFDYKNKYAIIEYIKELHNSENFRIIILTHNFDFYRTIASRLSLPYPAVFMASKSDTKAIKFHSGQYRKDVFSHFISRYSEEKIFISLIAFVRNLVEYSESSDCADYLTLTSCLHKKTNTNTLTADDIFAIYKKRLVKLNGKSISFGNRNLVQLIMDTADIICNDPIVDEVLLENKISLAIAIRLRAEEYLITKMPLFDLSTITRNQTQVLYQQYLNQFPNSEALRILEKVNLMTPENIHLNAFMYEPLIDMSVHHLINLFKETSYLN